MSNSVYLQITNIIWDLSNESEENLPKALELQWNDIKWKNDEVLNYISNYYNVKVNSLKIRQIANKTSSG